MMRIVLAAAAFIAAAAFDLGPASAREAPWCAVISLGTGTVYWDCQYNSVEECVPNVLAGNRGFCNHNPRWEGGETTAIERKAHKKRHTRRH
jgi:hypothetical protein